MRKKIVRRIKGTRSIHEDKISRSNYSYVYFKSYSVCEDMYRRRVVFSTTNDSNTSITYSKSYNQSRGRSRILRERMR